MRISRNGFTLIEILVVLLIVGITATFALMAFGDFGGSRRIAMGAEHFLRYVQLAQHQALIEGNTLGVVLHDSRYQLVRFKPPNAWQPLTGAAVFKPQHFPADAHWQLNAAINYPGGPRIIIQPTGDLTAFTITFFSAAKTSIATVTGSADGSLSLQLAKQHD